MTTPRIDELRRLEAAAGEMDELLEVLRDGAIRVYTDDHYEGRLGDAMMEAASLIASARNAFPLLLDVVEAAKHLYQHVDFGTAPPGWRQLHDALAALEADKGEEGA
jgi:hypothetical protein